MSEVTGSGFDCHVEESREEFGDIKHSLNNITIISSATTPMASIYGTTISGGGTWTQAPFNLTTGQNIASGFSQIFDRSFKA